MRTVFDNAMTAHVWAQQTQGRGKSHNGNLFFEGRTIYSYGYHFPIAVMWRGITLYNETNYSPSTGRHQSYVRSAMSGRFVNMNTRTIDFFRHAGDDIEGAENIYADYIVRKVNDYARSAAKRKKGYLAESDLTYAIHALDNAKFFFETLGKPFPDKLNDLYTSLTDRRDTFLSEFKERLATEKAEHAKLKKQQEAQRNAEYTAAKELWLNPKATSTHIKIGDGHTLSVSHAVRQGDTLLRVNGGMIETSHGAEFPVTDAKRAFMAIRAMREREISWDKLSCNLSLRLGHFRIDEINTKGDVKAGCHFVKWEAIEHCAKVLGIYP